MACYEYMYRVYKDEHYTGKVVSFKCKGSRFSNNIKSLTERFPKAKGYELVFHKSRQLGKIH